jgi:hypothetical protein
MLSGQKIVFYELNEVPPKVLRDFVAHNPRSSLARVVGRGRQFDTVAEDTGILSPWITWATLHRGVPNSRHCISDFGQDLGDVNAEFPNLMSLLARAGRRVGVFGSLHTYPLPENVAEFDFYVPDTFANGPECFPETLSSFQDFNLRMVDASGRNVSRSIPLGPAVSFIRAAPALGLRIDTMARLAHQLVSERVSAPRRARRRTSQVQIAFDLFYAQLERQAPEFATFFTNHVASAMHRYWPAKFPEDYKESQLDDRWRSTYADEIDFTMREADRQIARLANFVESHAGYALVVATSMGQAAVDASAVVHHQLYITDPTMFMKSLGVPQDGWTKHRAMLPRYIFRVSDSFADAFRKASASVTINGVPLTTSDLGSNVFQVKLGQENLTDDETIIRVQGQPRTLAEFGLANVPIQDATGSYAYHVPEGVFLIYDPRQAQAHPMHCGTISTLDIAPTILANFGVPRPGYMRPALP